MSTATIEALWSAMVKVRDLNGTQQFWEDFFWREDYAELGTARDSESPYTTSIMREIVRWDVSDIAEFLGELQTCRIERTIKDISHSSGTQPMAIHKGRAKYDAEQHSTCWRYSGDPNYMGSEGNALTAQASSGQADLVVENGASFLAGQYVALGPHGANQESHQIDSIDGNTLTLDANLTNTWPAGTHVCTRSIVTTVDASSTEGTALLKIASTTGMAIGNGVAVYDVSTGDDHFYAKIQSITAGKSITLDRNLDRTYDVGDRVCVWDLGSIAQWITSGGDEQWEDGTGNFADNPGASHSAADVYFRRPTTSWTNPSTGVAWANEDVIKIGDGSNVLLLGINGTTNTTPPSDEAQSWIYTDTDQFLPWMVGHTFTFTGSENQYEIVETDRTDRSKVRVDGNANGEGTSKAFTVDGQTAAEQQAAIKELMVDCGLDWGDDPTIMYSWWHGLDGIQPYDDPPNDDVPGEGFYDDPADSDDDYIVLYSQKAAVASKRPTLITRYNLATIDALDRHVPRGVARGVCRGVT